MWNKLKQKANEGYNAVDAGLAKVDAKLTKLTEDMDLSKALADGLGVRTRQSVFSGAVEIKVDLPGRTRLAFCRPSPPRNQIKMEELEQVKNGYVDSVIFDPGTTDNFDFCLIAYYFPDEVELTGHLLRGGVYRLSQSDSPPPGSPGGRNPLILETVKAPPDKAKSDLLGNIPRLSFGFAASGWCFVYQLGVAECLQNNGICKNPYVKVAGASGGALTALLMMYGADLPSIRDYIKDKADLARKDPTEAANLRSFILGAMKTIIKDGSYQHPALQSQRIEICFSESAEDAGMTKSLVRGVIGSSKEKAHLRRMKAFKDSSEAAIALLASSTMGISGLPFIWKNEEGNPVKVADGALQDFMPEVDQFSVRCMAFSDAIGISGKSQTEIMPTEFVPSNYGVFPPAPWVFDHMYELGYQDMSAWLENHLHERVAEMQAAATGTSNDVDTKGPADLPPVPEFRCADDGMTWCDKVLKVVPVAWEDQLTKKHMIRVPETPLKQGFLNMEAFISGADISLGPSAIRWLMLTPHELEWRRSDKQEAQAVSSAAEAIPSNPLASESGTMPLQWIESSELHPSDAQLLLIKTSEEMIVHLKAATSEEAIAWYADIKKALATLRAAPAGSAGEDA